MFVAIADIADVLQPRRDATQPVWRLTWFAPALTAAMFGDFLFCKHFQRQSIAEKNNLKVAGVITATRL